jgi:K+-transporting ATPase KdpF subunit
MDFLFLYGLAGLASLGLLVYLVLALLKAEDF